MLTSYTKRIFITAIAFSAALMALPTHAADEPVRIGFLSIKTGPLAGPGKQMEQGFELFLKEHNNVIAGRKIELIVVDTSGQPATTKTKLQELVERRKVDMVVGPLASNEALAINDYVRDAKVPLISPSALAEDMTQRKANPWIVRATASTSQFTHPLGEYAAKTLGYKRVATVATDFAYGHEAVGGFQRVFEENGGQVVKKIWVPLTATDFSTYIAQLQNVDAVFVSFSGSSAQNFLRQYNEFGLKAKIPLISSHSTVDEGLLPDMGDDPVGVISSGIYTPAYDNPDNKKYVTAYNKQYGLDPGFYATGAYIAGMFIESAMKATKGKVDDKAAFMKELRAVKLANSPRGVLRLDEYGNPVSNVFIRKTEKKDGKLQNTVIKTYENMGQFWNYDPKQFLANPVYSRDYPVDRFLGK